MKRSRPEHESERASAISG